MTPKECLKISAEEVLEKYGNVRVVFQSYYKYTFTYGTTLPDGTIISVLVGGDGPGIYKRSVTAGEEVPISLLGFLEVCIDCGEILYICTEEY